MIRLTTASGKQIQEIGLGSFPLQGEKMRDIALKSFSLGYGLIDTADDYRGETGIGLAVERVSEIGLRREDVFLQTKRLVVNSQSFYFSYLKAEKQLPKSYVWYLKYTILFFICLLFLTNFYLSIP